jgi:hypothetical protein
VKGHCGADHNRHGDDIRDCHAGERIKPDAGELVRGLGGRFGKRLCARLLLQFFDFLAALPEEHVGADGRA